MCRVLVHLLCKVCVLSLLVCQLGLCTQQICKETGAATLLQELQHGAQLNLCRGTANSAAGGWLKQQLMMSAQI